FAVDYREGAAVGYKWYDLHGTHPLFPFGYGLSYTDFTYSGAAIEQHDGRLSLHVTVTNSGNVAGKAVPQVYAAPAGGAKWEAPKRLVGWDKIELRPGESKSIEVAIDPRLLAMFDEASKTWRIAAGRIKFTVARDAADGNGVGATAAVKKTVLDVGGKPVSPGLSQR